MTSSNSIGRADITVAAVKGLTAFGADYAWPKLFGEQGGRSAGKSAMTGVTFGAAALVNKALGISTFLPTIPDPLAPITDTVTTNMGDITVSLGDGISYAGIEALRGQKSGKRILYNSLIGVGVSYGAQVFIGPWLMPYLDDGNGGATRGMSRMTKSSTPLRFINGSRMTTSPGFST